MPSACIHTPVFPLCHLTSVSTTFSVLAFCSTLIFSSSSLMAISAASRWCWTFSSSSCCSFLSCSSTQFSSSCRIWWRALNSPLMRACRSSPTLCTAKEKWLTFRLAHNAPFYFTWINIFSTAAIFVAWPIKTLHDFCHNFKVSAAEFAAASPMNESFNIQEVLSASQEDLSAYINRLKGPSVPRQITNINW